MAKQNVTAVIPAYKESERIRNVLKPLKESKRITEIIVVDDGSNDNIEKVVKKFGLRLIKIPKNMGKAFCMDAGVINTKSEIILFCDADLINLKPEFFDDMIDNFISGEYDMFLGLRNTFSNRKGIGLLTGLRVIKRELWEVLPKFYKKGFRIEVGLNGFSKNSACEIYDYHQTTKEKKYGFIYGIYRRVFMYLDVFFAYCSLRFYEDFRPRRKWKK